MKKSIALGLALAATMVGTLATSGSAMAVTPPVFIQHGSSCHNIEAGYDHYLSHEFNGLTNQLGSPLTVTCPLTTTQQVGTTAATRFITVAYQTQSQLFKCRVVAVRSNGLLLGATPYRFTPVLGSGSINFNNLPVGPTATYEVECTLPSTNDASIISIIDRF